MSKKIFKLSLILLVLGVFVSGCTLNLPWKKKAPAPVGEEAPTETATSTTTVVKTNDFKKFESYEELRSFLQENANNSGGGSSYLMSERSLGLATNGMKQMAPTAMAADSSLSASVSESSVNAGATSGTSDYSGTNNQVVGVDEADIIKTDGTYIYALVRNELSIIKATPAGEASVVSKITFKSRPQDLFINGTSLAVFGSDDQVYNMELYRSFRRQSNYTFFKVFDLTDPVNPKEVRDLDFEGSYTDARMIGDYVYFITNNYSNYIEKEPLTPRVLSGTQILPFSPDVFYFDIPYESFNYTSVTAINLKNQTEAISGQVYLMDGNQNLYVSENNLYLTYTQYVNEYDLEQVVKRELVYPQLSTEEQDKITSIEASPNYILSISEKKYKVVAIIDRYLSSLSETEQKSIQTNLDANLKKRLEEKSDEMEKTIIHKIAISGNKIEYKAKGEVAGQVLNQFSMDENNNYFRIATTRSQMWSRFSEKAAESYSNVFVLDADLKLVGSLKNLATNERIYSARFMGDRVYLVTFRQVDPLYFISLADPTKPVVLGALKIPGFSNYLHPVDKNGTKIIGFGKDTVENSNGGVTIKSLKLSLFDFTDWANPKELDSYTFGDASSDSIALTDHKAFLYSEAKNLLVIPAVLRENGRLSFGGSMVFGIDNNRFVLKGKIDHSSGGAFSAADYWGGYDYYDNTVKRSLYINDNLYTFSNRFLKINNLADLQELKSLALTAGGDDYIITQPPIPMPTPDPMPLFDGGAGTGAGAGANPGTIGIPGEVPIVPPSVPELPPVNPGLPGLPASGTPPTGTSTNP